MTRHSDVPSPVSVSSFFFRSSFVLASHLQFPWLRKQKTRQLANRDNVLFHACFARKRWRRPAFHSSIRFLSWYPEKTKHGKSQYYAWVGIRGELMASTRLTRVTHLCFHSGPLGPECRLHKDCNERHEYIVYHLVQCKFVVLPSWTCSSVRMTIISIY